MAERQAGEGNKIWSFNLTVAALVAVPGGLIQGYAGCGGALISLPFFVLLFGPVTGFAMILIVMFLIQASLFPKAVTKADWKEICPLAGASAITMSLGILFLVEYDNRHYLSCQLHCLL